MTDADDIAKLSNCDEDEIEDIITKLAKSFHIRFGKKAFENINTFGQLCDVFEESLKYNHKYKDDCTKQQAFYKIREAISLTLFINKKQIRPDTKLAELFPKQNRRKQVKEFQKQLGIKLRFLTYPNWLMLLFLTGSLTSFLIFFIDWKTGITGIFIFGFAFKIADYFGNSLQCETVRQLTEKSVREYYNDMRREKLTINKNEIPQIIKDAFCNDLSIDKKYLTREAIFN